jgi:glycosyltransferase involved in cell wall biosynthesis
MVVTIEQAGPPLVSICCATYNHEKYLAQAMNSFLMQKVSFPIEIVIGEDCSTDGTPQIVREYAERFPGLVKVITSDANVGAVPNALRIWAAASGKYIALCEGDDYWTDPQKLQRQVTFLEQNPDFAISGHRVKVVDDTGRPVEWNGGTGEDCPEVFGVKDAIGGTPLHMNSWVFRTSALRSIPREKMGLVSRLPAHDDPVLLLLLAQGKGSCLPETMGVWCIHSGSYWTSRSRLNRWFALLQFYYSIPEFLGSELERTHHDAVSRQVEWGEEKVARAVVHGSGVFAVFKLIRMMRNSELVPDGRIPVMLGRVARQVAAAAAIYPRALGDRALHSIGLR